MSLNNLKIYLLLSSLIIYGCETTTSPEDIIANNPNDPKNPNYQPPKTLEILLPLTNGKVVDSVFSISWLTNDVCSLYSFKLNNYPWSNWSSLKFANFYFLDDSTHTISVKSMHKNENLEEVPLTKYFTVDAIKNQSIYFYPRKVSVTPGNEFVSEIKVEELPEVNGFKIDISYNPDILEFNQFIYNKEESNFLKKDNGTILEITESTTPGNLVINLVRVSTTPYTKGSGSIGYIYWKLKYPLSSQKIFFNSSSEITKGQNKINLNYYSQLIELK